MEHGHVASSELASEDVGKRRWAGGGEKASRGPTGQEAAEERGERNLSSWAEGEERE